MHSTTGVLLLLASQTLCNPLPVSKRWDPPYVAVELPRDPPAPIFLPIEEPISAVSYTTGKICSEWHLDKHHNGTVTPFCPDENWMPSISNTTQHYRINTALARYPYTCDAWSVNQNRIASTSTITVTPTCQDRIRRAIPPQEVWAYYHINQPYWNSHGGWWLKCEEYCVHSPEPHNQADGMCCTTTKGSWHRKDFRFAKVRLTDGLDHSCAKWAWSELKIPHFKPGWSKDAVQITPWCEDLIDSVQRVNGTIEWTQAVVDPNE